MVHRSTSPLQHSAGMGAEHLAKISEDIRTAFNPLLRPLSAGLVLMPVDPQQLHAYWSLSDDMVKLGNGKPLVMLLRQLRPDDPDDSNRLHYEVALAANISQRNVRVPNQAHDYLAEIGFRDNRGRFITLLKSNRVHASHQFQRPWRSASSLPGSSSGSAQSRPVRKSPAAPVKAITPLINQESETDELIRQQMRLQGYYSAPQLTELPSSPNASGASLFTSTSSLPSSYKD